MEPSLRMRRRRRLVELGLAVVVLCGVSAALLAEGHHPLVFSGGLLASDARGR